MNSEMEEIPLYIVPIREEGYHVFIHIKVNGFDARMLLDTGASRTVFDVEKLKILHQEIEFEENEDKATGLGTNSVDNFIAILNELTIGNKKLLDYQVGALDLTHVNDSYGSIGIEPISGVLGADVLVNLKSIIDLDRAVLSFKNVNNDER